MTSLREEEGKRGGEGGKGMSHTTGHDLHSNPQWCHGQPGVLRAQTGVPSCSWVSRGRVWESPQLACSGERRRQWQLRQSRWKRRGWGRKDGGEGEERGVTCRMETACTDKQISIGVCVCVWVGVLCVQLVRPRLAALSCGCTLLLRVESIGACFRDDRGEWYEERGPLLPPPPPSSPTRTPTCTNSPSGLRAAALHLYFFHSFHCSSLCLLASPASPRMSASCVCHGWMWAWQQCVPVLFFFSSSSFFLEAAGGKWGREAIEAEKKDGIAGDLRTRCAPQCAGHGQQRHYKYWHGGTIAFTD